MASGRQLGEQNLAIFSGWVASKTEDDFRAMVCRGVLSRTEIAKECGFAKSALDQNPRIKAALQTLEQDLRLRGVLPPPVECFPAVSQPLPMREENGRRALENADRLRRLEHENAALKAEVAELKRAIEKFAVLKDALALTGRLPR